MKHIKFKRVFSLLLVCAMMAAMLVGCSSNTNSDNGGKAAANTSQTDNTKNDAGKNTVQDDAEQVLTIASSYTVGTFIPWKTNSMGDQYVTGNIYEGLVESNNGAKDGVDYVPAIAESWEFTDDTTCVFTIRQNVYWQTEGNDLFDEKVQVTAHDVKAVFDFILDEANGALARGSLAAVIASTEATSDFTFTVKTNYPYAELIDKICGVDIFPMKAIEEGWDLHEHPVGTGAFVFQEHITDDRIVLVANPDYRVTPKLDKVVIKIIPDKTVAAIALQNKEVDIVPQLMTTDLGAVSEKDYLTLIPNSYGYYRYLGFNCSHELFQDVKIREAISIAIDFEAITEALFANDYGAQLAINNYRGAQPPEFEGSDIDAWKEMYEYNPEKAQQILEDAGWSKNSSGIYEKDGKTFSFIIKSPANDQLRVKFGEMAATYLKAIGIDATSQPTEWATLMDDCTNGNTEMFINGGGHGVGGMNMLFHSETTVSSVHRAFFTDLELDAMIDEANQTVDDAKRDEILKACYMRALENWVHAGGYFEYVQIGMNRRVTDFDKSPVLRYSLCNDYRNVGVDG